MRSLRWTVIPGDGGPLRRGDEDIDTEGRPSEDMGRTQGLHTKDRCFRRNLPRPCLNLSLPSSRTGREYVSVSVIKAAPCGRFVTTAQAN